MNIRIGNAPASWGALEFDLEGKAPGYARVLDEMRDTGYVGAELGDWGFMPTEPVHLKKELDLRGIQLLSAFVPVDLSKASEHAAGEELALRTARLLAKAGGEQCTIVLADDNGKNPLRTKNAGRIRPEMGLKEEQWKVFAAGTNRIARAVCEKTGLRTVFHHHCAGYVETPAEIEKLLSLTDSGLLGLCLDTGHYQFGGGDPLAALQQLGKRIWHIHFKDCQPQVARQAREKGWDYFNAVRHGIFCELGQGEVDFPSILAEMQRQGYEGWIVVEQDVLPGMGTPKESARRNREYLKNIGV